MKLNFLLHGTFILLMVIFSCQKKHNALVSQEVSTPIVKTDSKIPDSLLDNSVFINPSDNGFTRIWVESNKNRGNFFYSDTLNVLNVGRYAFENNRYQLKKKVELRSTEWSYLTIDSASVTKKNLGNQDYLFLTIKPAFMGKAIPIQLVEFYMINLDDISDNISLVYSGYPNQYCDNCIKGEFSDFEKPDKNKKIWKEFQQYAKNSNLIYQPTKEEKSPFHYKNFERKWENDNQVDHHYGAGFAGYDEPQKSTYYKEKLFELDGSNADEIVENKNYIIATFFRGNLLGYDKNKKLYFPILVESCSHFCNKNLSFKDEYILEITYESDEKYEIDLRKIIFSQKI